MRKILRSLAKSLRRLFARLRSAAAWSAGFVDGVFERLLGGGHEPEFDDEEIVELANDQVAMDEIRSAPVESLGALCKRAGELRDAGRPFESLFDDRLPIQRAARFWVGSLDASGLRALRHMPASTVDRHLDPRDTLHGAGLPRFDPTATEKAAAPDQGTTAKLTAKTARSQLLAEARDGKRKVSLDDLVGAQRAYR